MLLILYGQAPVATAEEYLPETIHDLVRSFMLLFEQMLTPEEMAIVGTLGPEDIKDSHPVLYQKIRQNVKHWTDRWVLKVARELDKVPTKRLESGMQSLERVDRVLRPYFEANNWPYHKLQVVFLPRRILFDPATAQTTPGVFIPFYPEVFFATIDPNTPTEWVLLHESIHYNKTGQRLSRLLTEGITETLTRELGERHGLMTAKALRKHEVYLKERKLVGVILDAIMERTGRNRVAALNMLATAYLTGNQGEMQAIFGVEPWERVLKLTWSEDVKKTIRGVKEALQPADE
jgi:hypothetical protein